MTERFNTENHFKKRHWLQGIHKVVQSAEAKISVGKAVIKNEEKHFRTYCIEKSQKFMQTSKQLFNSIQHYFKF